MAVTTKPRSSSSLDYSGQKDVLMAVYRAAGEDRLSLLAAGVAFYVLFAIFPALGAATWIYGLLADPSPILQQLDNVREVIPAEAYGLIEGQLVALAAKTSTGITLTGIFSLLVFLYSARLAAYSTIQALNVVYKVKETRGFIEAEATAVLFTILAILIVCLGHRLARCHAGPVPSPSLSAKHREFHPLPAMAWNRCSCRGRVRFILPIRTEPSKGTMALDHLGRDRRHCNLAHRLFLVSPGMSRHSELTIVSMARSGRW